MPRHSSLTELNAVQRCRARQKNGLAVLPVEIPIFELSDCFVRHGFIREWDCDNRIAIAHAVETVLSLLIANDKEEQG